MSDIYTAPKADLASTREMEELGSVEKGIAGDYSFSLGEALSEGWRLSLSNMGTIWLSFILYTLGISAVMLILIALMWSAVSSAGGLSGVVFLAFLGPIALIVITAPIMAGSMMVCIKIARGEKTSATEVFSYFDKIVPLGLAMVLLYFFVTIGFYLLVIPGIYLSVAYMMALPLVVDHNLSPWQAMEASRKAITKNWFTFFGLLLVMMVIYIAGSLLFLIGLIFALPWICATYGVAYRQVFGTPNHN
ncbi:hypothetical protein ACJJIW_07630 [Microbulbifer sp. JMSA004]|uniref:hypothetical protein n=1 Tax=unclassified Microbulbifer TaxID=2619833 RepID=UPI0024AE24EC|nr:hypothetical protein [Microbulbifer sp. VAAF005]WHI45142.1 hypothetical protein P0078_15570 [Microbulbifer sp. VAAF005]